MLNRYLNAVNNINSNTRKGSVVKSIGLVIEAICPNTFVGELCYIYPRLGGEPIVSEVVGFKEQSVLLMPYHKVKGLSYGSVVEATGETFHLKISEMFIGRVINPFGTPLDSKGAILNQNRIFDDSTYINPMDRCRIEEPIETGVKAIDTFLTIGKGQRMGLLAGSGVGKSTLLSMISRQVKDEINVIALIGERGREVEEFVNDTLGEEGLKNAVVICATADESPLMRIQAVYAATAIAEYFSKSGRNVLFTMDSITRFAMALREVGLAIGEPPTAKGYTTSVFSKIPEIVERCGNFKNRGAITALFTVLVESGDFNDPIVDALRAILDGHIVLTRELAERAHFPAIDVLKSTSRLFNRFNNKDELNVIRTCKSILSRYQDSKELLEISNYDESSTQQKLIESNKKLNNFLQQDTSNFVGINEAKHELNKITENM